MSSGTTSQLLEVWGSSGDDVFAVGGELLHYDGTAWSTMSAGTGGKVSGVWGSRGGDVFTVGLSGIILHYSCSYCAYLPLVLKNR